MQSIRLGDSRAYVAFLVWDKWVIEDNPVQLLHQHMTLRLLQKYTWRPLLSYKYSVIFIGQIRKKVAVNKYLTIE